MKILTFISLIILTTLNLIASEIEHKLIINYNRSDYNAMSQNWSVAYDKLGRVYFGNNAGVLEYDGKDWQLHQQTAETAIRSLHYDIDSDRLYSGTYEDFGYWSRDKSGKMSYRSLTKGINIINKNFIWSIAQKGKKIIFQSFSSLYIYDTESEKIDIVDETGSFLFISNIDDQLFVRNSIYGICILEDEKIESLNSSLWAKGATARFFLTHKDGVIIGDGKTGLHIIKDGNIKEWNRELNRTLAHVDVNCATTLPDGNYAIGTLNDGLFIINQDAKIVGHINKHNGLNNNTILGLAISRDSKLWLGMDSGTSYIDLNSNLKHNVDTENAPSGIYSVVKDDNYIYVGTNNGLLYSDNPGNLLSLDFKILKPIDGIKGHIWKLEKLNNKILCCGNNGLFEISDGSATRLSSSDLGSTDFDIFINDGKRWLIESTYGRVRLYSDKDGDWEFSHDIKGFNNSCRFIEVDNFNNIWLSHEIKGLFRIKLTPDLKSTESIKLFDLECGLPTEYNLNVFSIDNRVVVTTGEKIYTYDDLNNKMIPFDKFNNSLGRFSKASNLIPTDNRHFWAVAKNEAAYAKITNDSISIERKIILNRSFRFPDKYQNISVDKNLSVICVENGYIVVNNELEETPFDRKVMISNITTKARSNITNITLDPSKAITLDHRTRAITFKTTAVDFSLSSVTYRYMLSKKDSVGVWINNGSNNSVEINDLNDGEFEFKMEVEFPDGTKKQTEAYKIEITPPWSSTATGIATLIIISILLIISAIVIYRSLLKRKTKAIESSHKEEHQKNRSTIEELQSEVLKHELEALQSKLTISANALINKDQAINSIKEEIIKINDKLDGRLPQRDYKKLLSVIDLQLTDKKDVLDFEQHFKASQSGFYKKLKEQFPQLSSSDLRLCSLLKMNLNSKEIAVVTGITTRSVEVSRYRLRKKLELDADINLTDFIMKY